MSTPGNPCVGISFSPHPTREGMHNIQFHRQPSSPTLCSYTARKVGCDAYVVRVNEVRTFSTRRFIGASLVLAGLIGSLYVLASPQKNDFLSEAAIVARQGMQPRYALR